MQHEHDPPSTNETPSGNKSSRLSCSIGRSNSGSSAAHVIAIIIVSVSVIITVSGWATCSITKLVNG